MRGELAGLDRLLRYRYAWFAALLLATSARQIGRSRGDWGYFVRGSRLLFGEYGKPDFFRGGLDVYANYGLQIGPLALLVATPFRLAGESGFYVVVVLMLAAVLPLLLVLEQAARAGGPASERTLICLTLGGSAVVVVWVPLAARWVHLDDLLVIWLAVVAIAALGRGRGVTAGVAVGLAIAAKPWAVLVVPMLVANPLPGRERVRSLAAMGLAGGLFWAPFVVANRGTLSAGVTEIDVDPASVLHLLGVPVGTAPTWTRLVQLLVALGLAGLAAWRGRWLAVPMVAIAGRLAFDPAVYGYYTTGLLVAALAWDLLWRRTAIPVATAVAFAGLALAEVLVASDGTRGVLRAGVCVVVIAAGLLAGEGGQAARSVGTRGGEVAVP